MLVGLVVGLFVGQKPTPQPAPIAVAPAISPSSPTPGPVPTIAPSQIFPAPTPAPTDSPKPTSAVAPTDALTLPAALAAVSKAGFGGSPATVIAARLTTVADLADATSGGTAYPSLDPGAWVWSFVIRGSFPSVSCGGYTATPQPCPSPATTMRILLDGRTGALIAATTPGS